MSETQATIDSIFLRAAQAEDSLVANFMRLVKQKRKDIMLLQRRCEQIEKGKSDGDCDPVKILELATE